jgi:anti-sigma factor RsiW
MVEEGATPPDDYCARAGRLDAAGWVLGALDLEDAERFAQHLPECSKCQLAVAELEPAGRTLLNSAATRPPARLADATLVRIRQAASRIAIRPISPHSGD